MRDIIFFCIRNIPNRCAAGMRQQSLQILKLPEPLAREASAVFHWMEPPRRATPCIREGGVRYGGSFSSAPILWSRRTVRQHNRRERWPISFSFAFGSWHTMCRVPGPFSAVALRVVGLSAYSNRQRYGIGNIPVALSRSVDFDGRSLPRILPSIFSGRGCLFS